MSDDAKAEAQAELDRARTDHEQSFKYLETNLNGRYYRKVNYEFDAFSSGKFSALLAGTVPNTTKISSQSSSFDNGRWKVEFGFNDEEMGWFNCYLTPISAPWDDTGRYRREVRYRLQLLVPTTQTAIATFDEKAHVYAAKNWNGWGRPKLIKTDQLLADCQVQAGKQLIVRYEITEYANSVEQSYLSPPIQKFQGMLETCAIVTSTPPDVRFMFPDTASIYAHSTILQKHCTYFDALLASDFSESTSAPQAAQRVTAKRTSRSQPALKKDNNLLDDSDQEQDDEMIGEESEWSHLRKVKTVEVTDFSLTTFKAFIFYLHTGTVEFRPLRSSSGKVSSLDKQSTKTNAKTPLIPTASPKSIYRLADKYDVPALKELARTHILSSLSPDNVLAELAHPFTLLFPEFIEIYKDYTLEHWQDVTRSAGAALAIEKLFDREDTMTAYLHVLQGLTKLAAKPPQK